MIYIMMIIHFIKNKLSNKISWLWILLSLLLFISSCNKENKEYLDTPLNLNLNTEQILSWDEVDNATGYIVFIENDILDPIELYTEDTNIDIFSYLRNTHEFKITVMAYDINDEYEDSTKSETLIYQTDNENMQFKVNLINGGKEYEIAAADPEKISGKVIIPAKINNIPVTKTTNWAFSHCNNITSIIVPSTITELGSGSFNFCENLVRVSLPNSIEELPDSLFFRCKKLKDVNIPESVKIIEHPFSDCESLEKIHIPYSVTSIKSSVFKRCDKLKDITIDEDNPIYKVDSNCIITKEDNVLVVGTNYSVIPEYVTEISPFAFSNCRTLEKIIIPGNVKKVGFKSFEYCKNLKEIIFEEGVEEILASCQDWDSIEKISLPHSATRIDGVFGACKTDDIFPNGNERYIIDGNCIIDLQESRLIKAFEHDVTIPSYVKIIGNGAFYKWKDEYIKLPDGIEEIWDMAFIGTKIKEIEFPSSLKWIGSKAFEDSALEKIIFNEGLEIIYSSAFKNCNKLQHVELPRSLKTIHGGAFEHCYCSIILHNTIDFVGISFEGCMVFTDFDAREFNYSNSSNISHMCQNSNNAYNCDISDGYVKSFQYFNYPVVVEDYIHRFILSKGGVEIFGFIPYREGYKFLGWTTNPETNEIIIEPKYQDSVDYYINRIDGTSIHVHVDKPNYIWYTKNMYKEWENGTIFYTVWEKIE